MISFVSLQQFDQMSDDEAEAYLNGIRKELRETLWEQFKLGFVIPEYEETTEYEELVKDILYLNNTFQLSVDVINRHLEQLLKVFPQKVSKLEEKYHAQVSQASKDRTSTNNSNGTSESSQSV